MVQQPTIEASQQRGLEAIARISNHILKELDRCEIEGSMKRFLESSIKVSVIANLIRETSEDEGKAECMEERGHCQVWSIYIFI